MLAGWARLKYSHLFHAAVSSSSPLQAQLDFPQYNDLMRDALASDADGVGGSEECALAVETGDCGQAMGDGRDQRLAGGGLNPLRTTPIILSINYF